MHLLDCEHPKRIFNKYTKEWQYVPCGKCASCLRSRSSQWVERLNVERKCWKYCLFFTLTYSDDYCPYLEKLDDNYLVDLTHIHQSKDSKSPLIDLNELYHKLSDFESAQLRSFLQTRDRFSYVSVYDIQCFVKRVRKNLYTIIKNNYENYTESDIQIRYYICSEYGSTTFRSHYHGLFFFSSEKQKSYIEEILHKSWKFGIVDTSYVAESNAHYLAKYVTCTTGMPKIYEHKDIRPFAVYSKQPPIGTLYFDDEKVRQMFDSCSPTTLCYYYKGVSVVNRPLWRTYKDRLFPKISGFGRFSHSDRVRLYRAKYYLETLNNRDYSAVDFARFMIGHHTPGDDGKPFFGRSYLQLYDDYISYLSENCEDLFNTLVRWAYVCSRVQTQSASFDVSIEDYVSHIEKFYNNSNYTKLSMQLEFEKEYVENYGSRSLVGLDKLYLETLLDCSEYDLSLEERLTLESYGIDIKKFTSDDLSERLEYQSLIIPERTRDYQNVVLDSSSWLKKSTKNKIKNDYLNSHPELINSYNSFNSKK